MAEKQAELNPDSPAVPCWLRRKAVLELGISGVRQAMATLRPGEAAGKVLDRSKYRRTV